VISRVTVVVGLIALGIVVLGGAVALVSWMIKQANTIRPKDGLFPLQRLPHSPRWLRWLGSDRSLRLYNPNINPAAVLEIRPDKVQYVGAEQVSASQMQAATQGQFVQAIAAEASGPKVLAGRQSKRSGTLQPPTIYERPIPDPILLPYTASHIDRLLEAQGEVFPAQVGSNRMDGQTGTDRFWSTFPKWTDGRTDGHTQSGPSHERRVTHLHQRKDTYQRRDGGHCAI
jgi:hypothetical protein